MTLPVVPDLCWPVDTSCCSGWDDYPSNVKDRAIALATSTLRSLSGYRVGGCPITVRPCRKACAEPWLPTGYTGEPGLGYPSGPVNNGGNWINMMCGCGQQGCACSSVCEVKLPGPVGAVESVQIGTQILPTPWYRVDDGNKLVWQGPPDVEDCWPLCQDMSAAVGSPDTFAVTYLNALPVDALGAYAAGVLACEFAKACSGSKCRLPTGVTGVARQGVTMTIPATGFPEGRTGIIEVDSWLRIVNPNAVLAPSQVWSPDIGAPRTTTWTPVLP